MRPAPLLFAAFVTALLAACRDGVPPFTLQSREPAAGQLTFGFGQDRDPRWIPDGTALLYHTDQYGPLPSSRGVLLTIPAEGGTALPLLGDVQRTIERPFGTPVLSPDAQRIAYIDLFRVEPLATCTAGLCARTQPVLDSAVLRVRSVTAIGSPLTDTSIGIKFAGTDPEYRTGGAATFVMQSLPFQQQYRAEQAMLFRPTWAPDHQRVAFSDGLQLYIWRVGEPAATPVPGTADGVSAAWSAHEERIAFTLLQRQDSTEITCGCVQPGTAIVLSHRRTTYVLSGPRVVIVRPDGTGRIELGPGEDPAWSPDGQFLYVRRNDQIVRVSVQSGAALVVPNTTRGRYPAVSPDGRRLAFARLKSQSTIDYDIWVVSLSQ